MRKWVSTILLLMMVAFSSFGCTGGSQEAKKKCPDCGTIFRVMPPTSPSTI